MSQSITSEGQVQASADQPDLSVVIVSWNVCDLLVRCVSALNSVDVKGELSIEVIVVDNGSRDGSAEAARALPGTEVLETGKNLGFGRANNLGLRSATGRHILVLNPDTVPQRGSLDALVQFAETHPRAGLVSPRLLNPDGSTQPAAFRFPTLLMYFLDLYPLPSFVPGRIRRQIAASTLNGRYPGEARCSLPFRIDHPLGACMLISRHAYEQCGGFDPAIFMFSEEVELALRYAKKGWQCWQVPRAQVVHLDGQSVRQVPDHMFVELWRSRLYVFGRYYSLPAQFGLAVLLAVRQVSDIMQGWLKLKVGATDPKHAVRRLRRARAVLRLVAWP